MGARMAQEKWNIFKPQSSLMWKITWYGVSVLRRSTTVELSSRPLARFWIATACFNALREFCRLRICLVSLCFSKKCFSAVQAYLVIRFELSHKCPRSDPKSVDDLCLHFGKYWSGQFASEDSLVLIFIFISKNKNCPNMCAIDRTRETH